MKMVIAIGNPGKKYDGTRHNIGYMVADALLGESKARWKNPSPSYAEASVTSLPDRLTLIKPLTYVNNSGIIVPLLRERYGEFESDIMVVCDDMSLPVGKIRIRTKGSSGGHNGLKSLIAAFGGENFARLRVGIGMPPPSVDPADYVLTGFAREEISGIEESLLISRDAVKMWVRSGIERCMNVFNVKADISKGGTD